MNTEFDKLTNKLEKEIEELIEIVKELIQKESKNPHLLC